MVMITDLEMGVANERCDEHGCSGKRKDESDDILVCHSTGFGLSGADLFRKLNRYVLAVGTLAVGVTLIWICQYRLGGRRLSCKDPLCCRHGVVEIGKNSRIPGLKEKLNIAFVGHEDIRYDGNHTIYGDVGDIRRILNPLRVGGNNDKEILFSEYPYRGGCVPGCVARSRYEHETKRGCLLCCGIRGSLWSAFDTLSCGVCGCRWSLWDCWKEECHSTEESCYLSEDIVGEETGSGCGFSFCKLDGSAPLTDKGMATCMPHMSDNWQKNCKHWNFIEIGIGGFGCECSICRWLYDAWMCTKCCWQNVCDSNLKTCCGKCNLLYYLEIDVTHRVKINVNALKAERVNELFSDCGGKLQCGVTGDNYHILKHVTVHNIDDVRRRLAEAMRNNEIKESDYDVIPGDISQKVLEDALGFLPDVKIGQTGDVLKVRGKPEDLQSAEAFLSERKPPIQFRSKNRTPESIFCPTGRQ